MKILLLALSLGTLNAQVIDTSPRRVASLTYSTLGTPANGTFAYCSDCATTSPCTASGSGATARREAGAWNCSGGGESGNTATIAGGTATLGTSAITGGTCATVVTVSATGVATTDTITADFNADPSGLTGYGIGSDMLTVYKYPTSNNVNFKVCNRGEDSVTPSAATLNWAVFRQDSGTPATAIAGGTASLGTSAITAGTCASVVTVSATGVMSTDTITADFNGDPSGLTGYGISGDLLLIYKYPTSNAVNFKVCNPNGDDLTPSSATLNWKVFR